MMPRMFCVHGTKTPRNVPIFGGPAALGVVVCASSAAEGAAVGSSVSLSVADSAVPSARAEASAGPAPSGADGSRPIDRFIVSERNPSPPHTRFSLKPYTSVTEGDSPSEILRVEDDSARGE